jgi:hypothetical protein
VRKSAFAVAMGVKRTCLFALHMSAFDPRRTKAAYAVAGGAGGAILRVLVGAIKNKAAA